FVTLPARPGALVDSPAAVPQFEEEDQKVEADDDEEIGDSNEYGWQQQPDHAERAAESDRDDRIDESDQAKADQSVHSLVAGIFQFVLYAEHPLPISLNTKPA